MSFKINRGDSATPSLPNSAVPQAKGSRPAGSGHSSIFSKPLFPRAPRNASTSMAPRDTIPLLSAEQRAAPSDGQVPSARSGLMKPASSLLSRAGKAMSSGAQLVSSGMHQAGQAMSGAYQALSHSSHRPSHRPSHAGYVRLEHDAAAHQGGSPHGGGLAPGVDAPPMPSSRLLAAPRARAGDVQQAAVHPHPPAGGTENANPDVSAPARPAAARKNLPAFLESFKRGDMDRAFEPQQLVEVMLAVSKGTKFEQAVGKEAADNPDWGRQMQQRWNMLRNTVADARDSGDTKMPSLEGMIADRPSHFVKFMTAGNEPSLARLLQPQEQAAPVQKPAAPQVAPEAAPTQPHRRSETRPQASRPGHAVQRPGSSEDQPAAGSTRFQGTERPHRTRVEPQEPRATQPAAAKQEQPCVRQMLRQGDLDRPLEPQQLVEVMVVVSNLLAGSNGNDFRRPVRDQIANNPDWGLQMQQRWNTLRKAVADASKGGDANVPSLQYMIANRPTHFIKFMGSGNEKSLARLTQLPKQDAPVHKPAVPEVPVHAPSPRPQGRRQTEPHAPRNGHAVRPPSRTDGEHAQPAAALKVLGRSIAASQEKGREILHRMFNAPTGDERAAATRESYAHDAQHRRLIAARDQMRNDMPVGPLVGRLKELDGRIAALNQRADAQKELNQLQPARKALAAERAGMQARLEGLRPQFQQARELAAGLKDLAGIHGAREGHYAIGGPHPLHDRNTIETNFVRLDESRHLLGKEPQLLAAQQQLRALLQSGKLKGLSPQEAGELGKLARLDVGAQFDKLNDLQDVVARTRANLRAMGAGGLFEGIRTTPEERKVDRDEALRNHQDALDNGYL